MVIPKKLSPLSPDTFPVTPLTPNNTKASILGSMSSVSSKVPLSKQILPFHSVECVGVSASIALLVGLNIALVPPTRGGDAHTTSALSCILAVMGAKGAGIFGCI